MKRKAKASFSGSIYYCPNCNQNDLLFRETEEEFSKLFLWEFNKKMIYSKYFCQRCNLDILKRDLITQKKTVTEFDSIKETIEKETFFKDGKVVTETRTFIDYSEYIPDVRNKTLYFDMVYMLIDFIEIHQPNINVENNKFYRLSKENTSLNDEDFNENFEEKISLKFKECMVEFNGRELKSLLRNSLNVLKGQLFVDINIQELYFNLFRMMEIGELDHQRFFRNLC